MITSQSAATAACHAIDQEVAVQDVDQEILQKQLLADAQILKWTAPSRNTRIKLAGIVLDDSAATFEGEWTVSSASGPLVGRSYKHDGNRRSRVQTATFTPEIPEDGFYQVSLLYTSHENRSSKARVKVEAADQSGLYLVNQKKPVLVEGHPRSLGVFKFLRGRKGRVIVSNEGSDGIVNVDGLQLVPVQP